MLSKGIDIIKLSYGEAYFDIPLFPFNDLPFPDLYHYSHSRGITDLRKAVASYFAQEYDFRFNPDTQIIITTGAKSALFIALLSIINPGDEVIIWEPQWVSYSEMIKLCYGVPVSIPYHDEVPDFGKYITPKTKCLIINNPNNPRGKNFSRSELTSLLNLAKAHDFYLLSDESYSDFRPEGETFTSLGNIDPGLTHSIVCHSMSKNYGISGWRIGYVMADEALIDQIIKVQQHLVTCPPTILELYMIKHFKEIVEICRPQVKNIVARRKRISEYMDKIGLTYLPGTSTFYHFASIEPSRLRSEEFCTRLLNEKHVSTIPGVGYGLSCDKFIRVSIGTETWERMTQGLDRVKQFIQETI
jgi:aspartate aminotransferase/aminotransferase